MNLPKDPIMLMSYINMQLRDKYDSLDDLCYNLDSDVDIVEVLAKIGYRYNKAVNQFTK